MTAKRAPKSTKRPGRPLRILADVHHYLPGVYGGSEVSLHQVLRWFADRGHEVQVNATYQTRRAPVDGITGWCRSLGSRKAAWDWCDLGITQHTATEQASLFAKAHEKPLVLYSHHADQVDEHRDELRPTDLVMFNNPAEVGAWDGPSLICRPPVLAADYATTPGDSITLVNLSDLKGGPVLWWLVGRPVNRNRRFLAVKGAWQWKHDRQIVPTVVPRNTTIIPTTRHMREHVYAKTRVLLMPSRVESFGRVGVEAAASGVPVIAHPTAGLREALGEAAIWVDRDDLPGWQAALELLDDPREYADRSDAMLARSAELDAICKADLVAAEQAFYKLAGEQ